MIIGTKGKPNSHQAEPTFCFRIWRVDSVLVDESQSHPSPLTAIPKGERYGALALPGTLE